MEEHRVKINRIEHVTHDTLKITTERPYNYSFEPGQATEVAIDKEGWKKETRPFTFTSLPDDSELEFIIKTYPEHDGTTDKLLDLEVGDHLLIHDVFGAITYQGPGTLIAGGAGITPFIAILRKLEKEGKLEDIQVIFENKTSRDIILHDELKSMLGDKLINILSQEKTDKYFYGYIDETFLKEQLSSLEQYFYLCGPPQMVEYLEKTLHNIGVENKWIVKEEE
ncbi:MAG: hypothetical protein K9I29_07555 [Bacteroidales bacterium]|nr:hypothetical protein [Bacteroidales bacterium]MCF8328138.1 hypothetical protein [Bacteroidales bacterium]